MNRDKREYLILRHAWGHWMRPVDLAEQINADRKVIAKDMVELTEAGFMLRRGRAPHLHYRTRAPK